MYCMADWYSEALKWQGAIGSMIGATLGFLALLAGALINYRLNRRRDTKLHQAEALSVAVALYSEIVMLRKSVAFVCSRLSWSFYNHGTRGSGEKIDDHFMSKMPKLNAPIYSALASKLGMLSPDLLLEIAGFHGSLVEVEMSLPLMIEDPKRGYTYGSGYVLKPGVSAVTQGLKAMRMIEKMAEIKPADEKVQLGRTDAMLDHEDSMNESHGE
jgi:hypothetical protein